MVKRAQAHNISDFKAFAANNRSMKIARALAADGVKTLIVPAANISKIK